jgi:geranylgeranyl pyrophosphate synthase
MKAMKGENSDQSSIDAAIEVLSELGSIGYAKEQVRKYAQSSFESIKPLKDTPAKRQLIELVNYFVQREY